MEILGYCGFAHDLPYSFNEYFSLFCPLWNWTLLSSISSFVKWVNSSLKHQIDCWDSKLLRPDFEPNCSELESYLYYLVLGKTISEPKVSPSLKQESHLLSMKIRNQSRNSSEYKIPFYTAINLYFFSLLMRLTIFSYVY